MKKIVIGSDKSGYELKEYIKAHLINIGYEVEDCGTVDPENGVKGYFVVAPILAEKISKGEYEKGILVCGTGTGMSIVANKYPGVYAALCRSYSDAKYCRAINNANVMCLGGWITGKDAGVALTNVFLETEFTQDVEDWRAVNLKNAFAGVQATEKEIYNK